MLKYELYFGLSTTSEVCCSQTQLNLILLVGIFYKYCDIAREGRRTFVFIGRTIFVVVGYSKILEWGADLDGGGVQPLERGASPHPPQNKLESPGSYLSGQTHTVSCHMS